MLPEDHVGIAAVRGPAGLGHWVFWVFWDGQQLLDPLGIERLSIVLEFWPLVYLGPTPAWVERLPSDWQRFSEIGEILSEFI